MLEDESMRENAASFTCKKTPDIIIMNVNMEIVD